MLPRNVTVLPHRVFYVRRVSIDRSVKRPGGLDKPDGIAVQLHSIEGRQLNDSLACNCCGLVTVDLMLCMRQSKGKDLRKWLSAAVRSRRAPLHIRHHFSKTAERLDYDTGRLMKRIFVVSRL